MHSEELSEPMLRWCEKVDRNGKEWKRGHLYDFSASKQVVNMEIKVISKMKKSVHNLNLSNSFS